MHPPLLIRRYQDSDKEAVWYLHKHVLESVGAFAGDGQWDDDLLSIHEIYLNGDGEFLIALIQDTYVGMGALRKIDNETAEIKRMRVLIEYQRQGIGQAIYDMLERKAKELGYKRLILDTTIEKDSAYKFYIKNGFKVYKQQKFKHLEQFLMEKHI